jgi:xanthine/uracil permease
MKVALHVRAPDKAPARDGPTAGAVKPAARFGLHLMQMCAAMCISLAVLAALYFGAVAVLGFSTEVWQEAPALSALVVSAVLAGSMVVWMRIMGMEWRPTIEMAGTAVAAGAVVLAAYWLGIVPLTDLLPSVCGVACLAMIGLMLFRVRLYSGDHAHAN